MRRIILLVAICAVSAVPNARAADVSAGAEAHVRKGIELRRLGRDVEALPEFQQAYASTQTPRTAGQLGLCEQALGRWTTAAEHLAQALEASSDAWVQKNRAVLEQQLAIAKSHTGTLEVIGEPPGAEVLVAGKPMAQLPMGGPITVNAGVVDVELRLGGYKSQLRSVEIRPGAFEQLVMRLTEDLPKNAPSLPVASPSHDETSIATTADTEPPAPKRKLWPWLTAGAIVSVAIAVGVVIALSGAHDYPHADINRTVGP